MRHLRSEIVACVLILLGPVAGLDAEEASSLTPRLSVGPTRTLSFPAGEWVGNLFLEPEAGMKWDAKGVRPDHVWEYFSPAQGDVRVPDGRNTLLVVGLALSLREEAKLRAENSWAHQQTIADRTRKDPEDLSLLSALDPNDLFWLMVNSPMYLRAGTKPQLLEPIRHLTGLRMLSLNSVGLMETGLEHLRSLRSLTGLELTQFPLGSRGLAVLKDLPNLEYLSLNTGLTDTGLKEVAQISSLRWLSIIDGRMWGPGLGELAKLPRLERLCIQQSRGQISDRHVACLEGLRNLKSLTFWSEGCNPLTDASLSSIAKLKDLEELHFIRVMPRFTAAGVAHLKALKRLKTIDFGLVWGGPPGQQYGDEIARQVAAMSQLESVEGLGYLSDEGLKTIATLSNLKCLGIALKDRHQNYYGPTGLSHLANLRSLEVLRIQTGDPLSDADVAGLEPLQNLKDLLLAGSCVGERGLASIGRLRRLERLDVDVLTRSSLNHLNGLANLEYLQVHGPWDERAGLAEADEGTLDLSKLKKLKDLNLTLLPLKDGDLAFLRHLTSLENLMIQPTTPVEGASLRHLGGLPELNRLFVTNLSNCSGGELVALNQLPKLRSLTLIGDVTDESLASLTGPFSLESLRVDTDHPIGRQTVTNLKASHPLMEYIHINKPFMPPQRDPPASLPRRRQPVRRRTGRRGES